MARSRKCRVCGGWHDTDESWPRACLGHYKQIRLAPATHIIKDIAEYQAVAIDKRTGKAPRITSRSQHREFLKANKYIEVGNDSMREAPVDYNDVTPREVRQAYEQLRDRR